MSAVPATTHKVQAENQRPARYEGFRVQSAPHQTSVQQRTARRNVTRFGRQTILTQPAVCKAITEQPTAKPASDSAAISIAVESGPSNSRRLYAGIDIAAPWHSVWGALTDYDGLADFIPGLAENTCLSRREGGARLLQIGEQKLTMGFKFRARVVLDIDEHPRGLPQQLIDDEAVDDGCFPGPRCPESLDCPHDIAFSLQEGDFEAFRGVWRIQDMTNGVTSEPQTRLSYALFVRPQKWLPIQLIQNRIEGEVKANLTAVRAYAERQ